MTSERQRAALLSVARAINPPELVQQKKLSELIFANDGTVNAESVRRHIPMSILDWYVAGTLTVGNNVGHEYVMPQPGTLTALHLRLKTVATGATVNVRITKNGASWITRNLPTSTQNDSSGITQAAYVAGDIIRLDITQIGSGSAGAALSVNLIYRPDIVG